MPDRDYRVGDLLDHLGSGEVWKIIRAHDLADDEWSEGMVPLASDFLIRLVHDPRPDSLAVGKLRRVHGDYLYGSSWRRREDSPDLLRGKGDRLAWAQSLMPSDGGDSA